MQLTEAHRMVQTTARRFAEHEIRPYVRERANDECFPVDVMRKLAAAGLLGGPFPEEYGGGGIDNVSYVLVCEAIGGASPSVFTAALTVQLSLVGTAIHAFGTDEQRRGFLPELLAARKVGAFALSEPNVGSDPAAIELTARRDGDEWVLSGSKFWISNGSVADVIVVFAQTDPGARHKGMAAFLVDGDSSGLERRVITEKLGLHASNTAALFFDSVRVGGDRLLGKAGDGFKIAQTSLESGRTSTAACAVGIVQTCLDACIAYASQRRQWGKAIAGHQLVQEMVADMATDCEAARLLTLEAARLRDAGEPATKNVVMAKHFATEAAVRAARTAIALHGGVGYLGEYPIESLLRDAIGLSLYEGTTQIQKLILGRELLGIAAF
ncbi:MAG TPA: acyl-CoA dehydrogenase family protein [Dehalococcoidia bacterium]|nr:acyl-CoA dehydrogenase family protein [Dehalococcoidia bacterium]